MTKLTDNGYIMAISATATDGTEITEQEYNGILSALQNRPQPKDGFSLMLKDGTLEWEFKPIEPEPEYEPTAEDKAEAYDILIGGAAE